MQVTHENILAILVAKDMRIAALEAEVAAEKQKTAAALSAASAQDLEIGRLRKALAETADTDVPQL